MRYELSDYEWTAIKPMLPNKPRGVRRVNDRRVLNGIFWVLRPRCAMARPARDLWSPHPLLQSLRSVAGGLASGIGGFRLISDFQKFRLPTEPNQFTDSRRPVPKEGRFAIVTDVERGMRWTRARL